MSDDDDRVGYGRPPKHSQFKKGQSGNPTGRRKQKQSVAEAVDEELMRPVALRENGKLKKQPFAVALVKMQKKRALEGDKIAARDLLRRIPVQQIEEGPVEFTFRVPNKRPLFED